MNTFGKQVFELTGSLINPPKSTLVSIVPFPIEEFKPGLIPGTFRVDASVDGRPQCTIIGDSIHYVWIDETRGSLKVNNPSYVIARSVVNDYNSSQLAGGVDRHPGFFWLMGEYDTERVEKEHKDKLNEYKIIQRNWFVELVKLADDDWEKTRQHQCISDIQRYAAREIDPGNTRLRPWVITRPEDVPEKIETISCPACGSDIPAKVVICRYCRYIIDKKRYPEMTFAEDIVDQVIGRK